MLGAFATKLLTDIAQAVCCLAKRGGSCDAPVLVQSCAGAPGAGVFTQRRKLVSNPFTTTATTGNWTSVEYENLHPTYWLEVVGIESAGGSGPISFMVPPGGSKVIAMSDASITGLETSLTFFPTADFSGTVVDSGSFDGTEIVQRTTITPS